MKKKTLATRIDRLESEVLRLRHTVNTLTTILTQQQRRPYTEPNGQWTTNQWKPTDVLDLGKDK